MKVTSLVLPNAALEDVRQLSHARGRKPAVILRCAVVLGLMELREDARPKPKKQEPKNDRRR